jgi:RHS repeat-associated protein
MTGWNVVVYIYGVKLIYSSYGWYVYNAHGDVVQLTGNDGAVIRQYDYDPFGVQRQTIAPADFNPYRYVGEYHDFESGYVYLRARYYDPAIGRFISEDSSKTSSASIIWHLLILLTQKYPRSAYILRRMGVLES